MKRSRHMMRQQYMKDLHLMRLLRMELMMPLEMIL
jgi:hypothetical protein